MTKRRQWPRGKNGDLPDWYGPDKPFVEWTLGEVMEKDLRDDELLQEAIIRYPTRRSEYQVPEVPDKLQWALAQAQSGDIAPLRALYPLISAYIHLPPIPKRRRGVTLPKNRFRGGGVICDNVVVAATIARDIYAQWRRDYGMKNRRRSLGQSTAVDVAVAYLKLFGWEVSVLAVERALWRHGRGRK
jgi:hypothetical protein